MLVGQPDGATPPAHRKPELRDQPVGERTAREPGQLQRPSASARLHSRPRNEVEAPTPVTPHHPDGVNPEQFDHIAFFDRRNEWIEMRLRARRPCSVLIAGLGMRVEFAAGEELRTEISAKFTRSRLEADFEAAGLALDRWFTDRDQHFALSLARRIPQ